MNTRNLRKRGQGWAAVVYVPQDLQELAAKHYGGGDSKRVKEIVRGLGTRDLKEANRRKLAVIAMLHSELAQLSDPVVEAQDWAKSPEGKVDAHHLIHSRAEEIEKTHGLDMARRFYNVATNTALPMSLALEQWKIAATGIRPGTMYQYERDIQAFINWSKDVPVQSVDEDTAALWWNHLKATPTRNNSVIAPNTLNRRVGSLNRLWKWMKARKIYKGHNPWEELLMDVPGEAKRGTVTKELRAMTRDEAKRYLKAVNASRSKYTQAGSDVLILFWHTGVRPEDLSMLTVDQVLYDAEEEVYWLTILKGKTESNTRLMPVVSVQAKAVLERRLKEAKDGVLFHEVETGGPNEGRYWRIQKVVNPIRRKVLMGVPVDTYSMRRSFSTACEEVGMDPVMWSRMMGHTAPTLAASVYNRGNEGRKRLLDGIRLVEKELGELG